MNFEKEEKHESYGLLSISRIQGSSRNLFGSSIKHNNTVALEIKTASVRFDLSQDWFHEDKDLIRVEMSPTQFAEAITTLNFGSGIPVTIKRHNGKCMEEPPHKNKTQQYSEEFENTIHDSAKFLDGAMAKVNEMLDGKITKGNLKELKAELEGMKREFALNIPFVREQFNEQMDKTVTEAKGEVDAFVTNLVHRTGLEALKQQAPQLEHKAKDAS